MFSRLFFYFYFLYFISSRRSFTSKSYLSYYFRVFWCKLCFNLPLLNKLSYYFNSSILFRSLISKMSWGNRVVLVFAKLSDFFRLTISLRKFNYFYPFFLSPGGNMRVFGFYFRKYFSYLLLLTLFFSFTFPFPRLFLFLILIFELDLDAFFYYFC